MSTVYLMYHELEVQGRRLCRSDPGYLRYIVHAAKFRSHLARLKEKGLTGLSVTEALHRSDASRRGVAITFDDGSETDLITAAPALKEIGFNATFYIVPGFVGRQGYLCEDQIRELSDQGFEIGCHSMTHSFLSDLGPDRVRVEIVEARDWLEQRIGRAVNHFSCPGGRWDRRVARIAEEAGYHSVATSRISTNSAAADRFRLSRVVVMRGTKMTEFDDICEGRWLLRRQARVALLAAAKRALGNSMYERVRSTVLGPA